MPATADLPWPLPVPSWIVGAVLAFVVLAVHADRAITRRRRPGDLVPYLTLPPSRRRRARLIAHPELALGPGWVAIGTIGIWDAWTGPIVGYLLVIALVTSGCVVFGGAHLLLAVLLPVRLDAQDRTRWTVPISRVWAAERAGWIIGITGWAAYAMLVGYRSPLIFSLAVCVMCPIGALRLVALGRMEDHIRAVTPSKGPGDA